MTTVYPIELYADISKLKPGQASAVQWWVLNRAQESIARVEIRLIPQNIQNFKVELCVRERPIAANAVALCMQPVRLSEYGYFPFQVELAGNFVSGRRFHFVVEPTPALEALEAKKGGTLNLKIGAAGIANNVVFDHFDEVNIEAGDAAYLKQQTVNAPREKANNALHAQQFTPEELAKLTQLPLVAVQVKGLAPLNLTVFADAWPGLQGDLKIAFVNAKNEARSDETEVGYAYRMKIRSDRKGYLSLIAHDAIGNYHLLAPNNETIAAIEAYHEVFLPGQLLPSFARPGAETLTFDRTGEERVLALLTDQRLFADGKSATHVWSDKDIASILEFIYHTPNVSLAYCHIRVKPDSSKQ